MNYQKQNEETAFNPYEWEECISTEEGEVACCEYCKTISAPTKAGDHIFCKKCKKYIWRKKRKNESL